MSETSVYRFPQIVAHGVLLLLGVVSYGGTSCAQSSSTATPTTTASSSEAVTAIMAVLEAQVAAWNAANIDGFMQHYWKSDQLSFCSGGERTFGWSTVAQRYKKKYSSPELMGKLSFDNLHVQPLSDELAMVIGDWNLQRSEELEKLGGNFTLLLKLHEEKWSIIHDHTSVRASESQANAETSKPE